VGRRSSRWNSTGDEALEVQRRCALRERISRIIKNNRSILIPLGIPKVLTVFLFHTITEISDNTVNLKGQRDSEKGGVMIYLMNRLNWVTFNTVGCGECSLDSTGLYEAGNTNRGPWTLSITVEAPVWRQLPGQL
jgi:hypothetical protein